MTNYELMFIIDPVLDEEAKKETIETVKGIIAAEGAVKEEEHIFSHKPFSSKIFIS